MNNEILELIGRYLAENPETATRLIDAARRDAASRDRRQAFLRRRAEIADSLRELDSGIALATTAVNTLKGDLLRLQKERKRARELLSVVESELADAGD